MSIAMKCALSLTILMLLGAVAPHSPAPETDGPSFTRSGQLAFPTTYREWTFLTSGLDMSYRPNMQMGDQHNFGNVFVNPSAFRYFIATGAWPDKTAILIENRDGRSKGSINKSGLYQTAMSGIEVHVKDVKRFRGGWGFFFFNPGDKRSTMIPLTAACYACHTSHAAVDTTFVQFYPTLLPIATAHHTLGAGYLRDERN